MQSVRDHVVTIAKSANATGKTHGAARVAAWWYKVYEDSQVYTAAAPPGIEPKKQLWGEIGGACRKTWRSFQERYDDQLHIQRSAQSFLTGVTIPSSGTEAQREAKFSGKQAPIYYLLSTRVTRFLTRSTAALNPACPVVTPACWLCLIPGRRPARLTAWSATAALTLSIFPHSIIPMLYWKR